jgi:ribosomal protein L21E
LKKRWYCVKEERKIANNNSFNPGGVIYTISGELKVVVSKVKLHIHTAVKIGYKMKQILCQLQHILKNKLSRALMFIDQEVSF